MDRAEAIKVLEDGNWWDELSEWYMVANPEYNALDKAIDLAIAALREQEQLARNSHDVARGACKWISVKDKKPSTKKVIDGETYYRNVVVLTNDPTVPEKIAYYDENVIAWFQPLDFFPLMNVTHWMPLPEPPKEGADHE